MIGQRIKKIREEKGITEESMALRLKIKNINYGLLENNDRRLNVLHLIKIAKILNINIDYLFSDVINITKSIEKEKIKHINEEVFNIIIESQRNQIKHLKEEVGYLRVMVKQ